MQSTSKLSRVLTSLIELVEDEAKNRPDFAARLEAITAELPQAASKAAPRRKNAGKVATPDVFAALQDKGSEEFRFWLRELDLPTLKAIVKLNGFDSAKVSHRWKEPEKFIGLIAEQTMHRLQRDTPSYVPKPDRRSKAKAA